MPQTENTPNGQASLFETSPDWQSEWQGMPEFIQERQREYAKIIVRFRCKEDLDDFAKLIGQRLNRNSQCTWHPELTKGELGNSGKKYVSES